jgi:hypothetical protein
MLVIKIINNGENINQQIIISYKVFGILPVIYPSRQNWPFMFSLGVLCFSSPLACIAVPVWVSHL